MNSFSIAICTYNRLNYLRKCLSELIKFNQGSVPIIVVDNNCNDGTEEYVQGLTQDYPFITYLFETNKGLSFARNRAIKECNTPYLFYIDDDAYPQQDYLPRISFLINHYDFDALGGKEQRIFERNLPKWYRYNSSHDNHPAEPFELKKGFLSGFNIGFRVDTLVNLGGFDTRIGMKDKKVAYGEETLMVEMIRRTNGRVLFDPILSVMHHHQSERLRISWMLSREYAVGRDWWITFDKKSNAIDFFYLTKELLWLSIKGPLVNVLKLRHRHYYIQNFILDTYGPVCHYWGRIVGSLINRSK